MSGTTCLIGIFIVIVLVIIVASFSRSQAPTITNPPPVMPPPYQPLPAPPASGMVVIARRPGVTRDAEPITNIPPDIEDPIHIPPEMTICHNQKTCKVCQKTILWSSRSTGWARCMSSRKLVHGHCHNYMLRQRPGVRNWCTVCNGTCISNQAMRNEGRS